MTNLQKQALRSRSEQDRHWCALQDWYARFPEADMDQFAALLNVGVVVPGMAGIAATLALVALAELGLRRLEVECDESENPARP